MSDADGVSLSPSVRPCPELLQCQELVQRQRKIDEMRDGRKCMMRVTRAFGQTYTTFERLVKLLSRCIANPIGINRARSFLAAQRYRI